MHHPFFLKEKLWTSDVGRISAIDVPDKRAKRCKDYHFYDFENLMIVQCKRLRKLLHQRPRRKIYIKYYIEKITPYLMLSSFIYITIANISFYTQKLHEEAPLRNFKNKKRFSSRNYWNFYLRIVFFLLQTRCYELNRVGISLNLLAKKFLLPV